MVRDLVGTIDSHNYDMGLLILMTSPTRGVLEAAAQAGTYKPPLKGGSFPRVQIITVEELLAGVAPRLPTAILPYIRAAPKKDHEEVPLF